MISVCIATYNGEKYIREQIQSIASQLSDGDEIIISDDGSTDHTLEIIESLKIRNLYIFINKGRKGYTPNFENALRHSKGDYIFFSDQDDIWAADKVSKCMKVLKNYDFVISDAAVIDENRNILFKSFWEIRKPHKTLLMNIVKFGYLGCCMAFRRNVLSRILPLPTRYDLCTYDNWTFLVAAAKYKVFYLDKPLIYYRRHRNNTSHIYTDNKIKNSFRIKYRIYLIYNLLKRL